jgi:DNA polymerase III sliding clamp (beta) subunit (PCNA family)
MIEAIRFVRGAVAKKDYVPELTHFHIAQGRITGFNGIMALSSPIELDVDARPQATTFANAVMKCDDAEAVSIHMTKAGRLSLNSGKFRALIPCIDADFSMQEVPDGQDIDVGPEFMNAIRAVEKFQGIDASRPWALGILFHKQSTFATNNVVFVEYWHGHQMPFDMQIPTVAVKELLRINQTPIRVTASQNYIKFHFEGDRWLRTALIAQGWPENAIELLDRTFEYKPIPEGLFDGLTTLKPFLEADEKIFFREGQISTAATDEAGSHYQVDVPDGPCFSYKVLDLLRDAKQVDFSPHPDPCGFTADGMRGMFMGLRV